MYAIEYRKPKTLAEAAQALSQTGGKALAGGQSLVAAMKLRLAQPGTLVDLDDVRQLLGDDLAHRVDRRSEFLIKRRLGGAEQHDHRQAIALVHARKRQHVRIGQEPRVRADPF